MMQKLRFPSYAWAVLFYNILVVLWGAVVRASGSGDGCGKNWPLCQGEIVPTVHRMATIVEVAHRYSTGIAVILLVILAVWAYRLYPSYHPARLGVKLSIVFTFSEALLGAGLVLFKLVAHNDSVYRAIAMSLHLTNTLILLASLTLTVWWSQGGSPIRIKAQEKLALLLAIGIIATILLAVSGSVTALVDTLYPAASLTAALQQDLYPGVHYLIRLRIFHPFIALAVMAYSIWMTYRVVQLRPMKRTVQRGRNVAILFVINVAAGFLNLSLLAPIWLQILHLLLADILWINLILFAAEALAKRNLPIEAY